MLPAVSSRHCMLSIQLLLGSAVVKQHLHGMLNVCGMRSARAKDLEYGTLPQTHIACRAARRVAVKTWQQWEEPCWVCL